VVSRIFRMFNRKGPEIDCGHVRDLSSDFIDDELDEVERKRIMEHLEKCGLCMAFINTLRATVALLSSSDTPKPPPTLKDRIRSNLPQDEDQNQG
jgi:predicted anti-sigma-YlaC factor YlaD